MGFYRGPNIIRDGLVLYLDVANQRSYPGIGTTWNDLSGNGNNGTLINGPIFNSIGNGNLVFDGSNDYVNINASDTTNIRGSITVSMFCKSNYNSTLGWNNYWAGVSKYNQFVLGPNGANGTGKMAFIINSGGDWYPLGYNGDIWGQTNINPKDWHLYTGVYNQNTGMLYLYIDGIEEVSFNIGIKTLTNDLDYFNIGRRDNDSQYLNSSISHVSIYNRALSPEELLQNYNATKSRFNL